MDAVTKATLIKEGAELLGTVFRTAIEHSPKKVFSTASVTDYPEQTEALKNLGPYTVVSLHDNGDALVKAQGRMYLVTPAGNVFEQAAREGAASLAAKAVTSEVTPKPPARPELVEGVTPEVTKTAVGNVEIGDWVSFRPDSPLMTVEKIERNWATLKDGQGNLQKVVVSQQVYQPLKPSALPTPEPRMPESSPRPATLLPTSDETTTELKRRLARELYRAELDLANGLKIANKPCDCLTHKHALMLEAASEELISQDPDNLVYQEIIDWIPKNQHKVTIEAIQSGKYKDEYPYMAKEFKNFRKRVMGTVGTTEGTPGTITLEQAKKEAAEIAAKEVEKQWHSVETK